MDAVIAASRAHSWDADQLTSNSTSATVIASRTTNTKWRCRDCNRKNDVMSPAAFEAYGHMWEPLALAKGTPSAFRRTYRLTKSPDPQ